MKRFTSRFYLYLWSIRAFLEAGKNGHVYLVDNENSREVFGPTAGSNATRSTAEQALLAKITDAYPMETEWNVRLEMPGQGALFVSILKIEGLFTIRGEPSLGSVTKLRQVFPAFRRELVWAAEDSAILYIRPQVGKYSFEWETPPPPLEACDIAWRLWDELAGADQIPILVWELV